MYKTNLKIAIERIKDFVLPGEENKQKPDESGVKGKPAQLYQRGEAVNSSLVSDKGHESTLVGSVAGKYEDSLAAAGMNFDENRFDAYRNQDFEQRNSTNFI